MNIYSTNLNLLVTFDALMGERSVTRAAKKLGLSQSAVSNALAQLRELFRDPLFTRTRYGIEPTRRALELSSPVKDGLAKLDVALEGPRAFSPFDSDRSFVIAADDYVEWVLLPPVMKALAREAPRVRLELRHWGHHHVPDDLRTGAVDLMLGYYRDVPPAHRDEKLFRESYVCLVRKGHPRVKERLTLKAYVELTHVLVSQRGDSPGEVDVELTKLGLSRHVGVRVSHFLMVPPLIAQTDMIAALSRRVAEPHAKLLGLRIFQPPLALSESRVGQVWHARSEQDPAHEWLRQTIRRVAKAL